ncbi:hypothetical protein RGQ29_014739 [Quercus rubra]|uniref:Carboxypeptidase n=1 Tax=Quercus rubra TaxID=3512 RepID=A0AAN7FTW1_QUERU|nr:hypothetical protein RGQ29_014739 [Quercus rubra]
MSALLSSPTFSSSSTSPFSNEALPTKSGYLPVKPTTGSTIFYAFYEAWKPNSSLSQTLLLIWLQGGPECSSMIGNFFELGPWRNQYSIATHLFATITSFIALDPLFKFRPIYITGESYTGKYDPAIGYYIVKKNAKLAVSEHVNLAGVAIGNGLTNLITQVVTHAVNAYFSSLINERQKGELEKAQWEAIELNKLKNWSKATTSRIKAMNLLQNMTGLATLYDFTKKVPYKSYLVAKFLQNKEVKKALGVNESIIYEECSAVVGDALYEDVRKTVKYIVQFLVKKSKVLLYQGHFDLRDGVVSTEAWVKTMKWEGIENFSRAERKVWKVNGGLAGFVQKWGSLSHVVVLGAGHLVPIDQSLSSQATIEDWVLERGLFGHQQKED